MCSFKLVSAFAATLVLVFPNRLQGCWAPADLTPQEKQYAEALKLSGSRDFFGCKPEEVKEQAERLKQQIKAERHASACAKHWWIRQLAALKLNGSRQTTIVDIGCNKGYFFGGALEYLAPDYGDHQKLLHHFHTQQTVYTHPCGMCNECESTPEDKPIQGQRLVDILCVEPSEVHVNSLITARDSLYGRPDAAQAPVGRATQVRVHIKHGAMSNYSGMTRFQRNCTVNTCSIRDFPNEFEVVPVTTVDEEMRARGWEYLDVMKVDTEGFDPTVLAGAYRMLANHRIGIVSYEYHHLWSRTNANDTLQRCTRYMEDLGYACFVDAPVLTKISGGCWDKSYEFRQWSNIVCVLRGTVMEAELTAGSWLAYKVEPRVKGKGARGEEWRWVVPIVAAMVLGVAVRHFGPFVAAQLSGVMPGKSRHGVRP